jgi:CheY-like chemotaxis protein
MAAQGNVVLLNANEMMKTALRKTGSERRMTQQAVPGMSPADPYLVFLVEDDRDDRLLLAKTLRQSPRIHDIRPYESGDKLLFDLGTQMYYSDSVIHTLPTVILLDVHTPGAGGIAALRQLKSHSLTAGIPVLIVTNDDSIDTIREARRLGADAYLIKPLDLEDLHQALAGEWAWPESAEG